MAEPQPLSAWMEFAGKYGITGVLLFLVLIGGYDLAKDYIAHLGRQIEVISSATEAFTNAHVKQSKAVQEIAEHMKRRDDRDRSRTYNGHRWHSTDMEPTKE